MDHRLRPLVAPEEAAEDRDPQLQAVLRLLLQVALPLRRRPRPDAANRESTARLRGKLRAYVGESYELNELDVPFHHSGRSAAYLRRRDECAALPWVQR